MSIILNLSNKQFIKFIDTDIDFALSTADYILRKPEVFKHAIDNPQFRDYLRENRDTLLRNLIRFIFSCHSQYVKSDGTFDEESLEFISQEMQIYDEIKFRTFLVYHLLKSRDSDKYRIVSTTKSLNYGDFLKLLIKFLDIGVDIYDVCDTETKYYSIINYVCKYYDLEIFKLFLQYHPDILNNVNDDMLNFCVKNKNMEIIRFILNEHVTLKEKSCEIIEELSCYSRETFYLMMSHPDYINYLRSQPDSFLERITVIFNTLSVLNGDDFDFFIAELGIDIFELNADKFFLLLFKCNANIIDHINQENLFDVNDIINNKCIIDCLNDRFHGQTSCNLSEDNFNDYTYVLDCLINNQLFIWTKKNISAIRTISPDVAKCILQKVKDDIGLYAFSEEHFKKIIITSIFT